MHASPTRHTPRFQYTFASDAELRAGVKLWFDDNAAAKEKYGDISDWGTSQVKDMSRLFRGRKEFNEDLSKWNVSSVTNMHQTFRCCTAFNGTPARARASCQHRTHAPHPPRSHAPRLASR